MKKLPAIFGLMLFLAIAQGALAWEQYGQMYRGFQMYPGEPGVSAALYVAQRQWPAGYGIRLYVPDRRTADIHVSVEQGSLFIRSQGGEQLARKGASGPVFMQFGSFSQWLTLPADADTSQMKLTSNNGVIDIYIPRR